MGGLEKSLINLCNNIDYNEYDVDLYLFNEGRELLPQLNKHVNLLPDSPYYAIVYNMSFFKSLKTLIKMKKFRLALYRIKRFIKARLHIGKFSKSDWRNMKKTMLKIDKHYDAAIGYEECSADYYVADCVSADVKSAWIHTDIKRTGGNKKLDKKTFGIVDYICTVSEYAKKSIIDLYPDTQKKIKVFYLPALYDYEKIKVIAKEPINIDKDGFTIVAVGRLVELKGFHLCVEACARLLKDGYRLKFLLCGDGDYRQFVQDEIERFGVKESFVLLGNCLNPYKYINAADICVQPSSYEGFGLSVYEEKLFNKAVVVSDIPAYRESITDQVNGLIVPRSADGIYQGLKRLLDDEKLLAEISATPINNYKSKEETVKGIVGTFYKNE